MSAPNLNTAAPAQYAYFTANGTTTIFTGPGIIYGFAVLVAGVTSTITLYDNTAASGNLLFPSAASTASTAPSFGPGFGYPENGVECKTGLTVVLAGGTAATVAVHYRPYLP